MISCGGDHRCRGNHAERTERIAISISDITRAPAPVCCGIAVASAAAALQEITRRYSGGWRLSKRRCCRMRHEQMQRAALCQRRVGRKTSRRQSKRNQEASHGSLLWKASILELI